MNTRNEAEALILDQIRKPNDIKKIPEEELSVLAEEIREFLIDKVSVTGGHLASNLGVVELTIALHRVLSLPEDKIIWDVGHQSYTHKLLTGRRKGFDTLREFGGMSGFPKRGESPCDVFDTGHSSTSVSAGLGLVKARDLKGEKTTVVSVIGDGSLTGGMAFEALNNAGQTDTNFIIVLNDNQMSIAKNVGGLSRYLGNIRTAPGYTNLKNQVTKTLDALPGGDKMISTIQRLKSSVKQFLIPGMLFEDLGITYLGPVDGHSIPDMERALEEAKRVKGPVLVHVLTVKGKGYSPAEKSPTAFHGVGPFDPASGTMKSKGHLSYTEVFSRALCVLAKDRPEIAAITAAMPDGTGLARFAEYFPGRYFDVGIAEQHAVTFAAGLAAGGLIPVVAVYSSFLQRAYDQIIHDVCLQNLHVIFAIDRAGLVGQDGETHQGIFDVSFLRSIPGMTVMAPKNSFELIDMLSFAADHDGPVAVRYPRGDAYEGFLEYRRPIVYGKGEYLYEEEEIALFAFGAMVKWADKVRKNLKDLGFSCSLVNARFAAPLDEELIRDMAAHHRLIVIMEENVRAGGLGEAVEHMLFEECLSCDAMTVSLPDSYIEQGDFKTLQSEINLDEESIALKIAARVIGERTFG